MNKFRTAYDGQRGRVAIVFPETGRTKQAHKTECDINHIIKRYDKTGLIAHVNESTAVYGDFTDINEYQQSLNRVIEAQEAFMDLPSNVRKRFSNDPGEFFEFCTNPANMDEMIALGLAEKPIVPVVDTPLDVAPNSV